MTQLKARWSCCWFFVLKRMGFLFAVAVLTTSQSTATRMILPIALAVTKGLTVADLAQTFAIYPSLSGSITEAGRRLMGADHLA